MSALQTFRHYRISQDPKGGAVEVWRSGAEVVCLAVDTLRQVFVELHVCIPGSGKARDLKQFQQVAGQAGQIRNRHLLAVLDSGEDEGAHYYVTEFVDGERLDTFLARCNPLPAWLALHILNHVVEGLQPLAGNVRLLAGLDIFNSSIQLLGESPADLLIKVGDLGLSEHPPKELMQPGKAETRVLQQTARLLFYMMTGSLKESALEPADIHRLAPEIAFLLTAIIQADHAHHPATLEQLRTFLTRWRADLPAELITAPDKLPASLRPRLPLQAHFLQPAALAESLSEDFQVDGNSFDALAPYRHQATARSTRTPASIQLLPPERLMPKDYARSLRTALQRINSLDHPNLFRIIAYWESEHPEFFIEEAAGRLSLASVVKLRGSLTPQESVLVLEQLHEANRQAEACGLVPVLRSPQQIFFHFVSPAGEAKAPLEADLAKLPLMDWPTFRIRVRTYPICLNLSQPERFNSERLLPSSHPAPETGAQKHSSLLTPATCRDFALLTHFMISGMASMPEKLKHLIYDYLGNRREAAQSSPKEFIDRLAVSAGRPASKAPVKKASPSRRKKGAPETEEPLKAESAPAYEPPTEEPIIKDQPSYVPLGRDSVALTGAPNRVDSPGFAEVLFGAQLPDEDEPQGDPALSPLFQNAPPALSNQDRNFLDGPPDDDSLADDISYLEEPERKGPPLLLLILLVVLVAALVAGAIAHLTGMAFWLRK